MLVKVNDILNAIEALNSLADIRMNAAIAFKVVNNVKSMEKAVETFIVERDKLYEEYREFIKIEEIDDKEHATMPRNEASEYQEKILAMVNVEVPCAFSPFKLEELESIDVTPITLSKMFWLLEE
jgi:hypothetical protein